MVRKLKVFNYRSHRYLDGLILGYLEEALDKLFNITTNVRGSVL